MASRDRRRNAQRFRRGPGELLWLRGNQDVSGVSVGAYGTLLYPYPHPLFFFSQHTSTHMLTHTVTRWVDLTQVHQVVSWLSSGPGCSPGGPLTLEVPIWEGWVLLPVSPGGGYLPLTTNGTRYVYLCISYYLFYSLNL